MTTRTRWVVYECLGDGLLRRISWTHAVSKLDAMNKVRYRLYGNSVKKEDLCWVAYPDPKSSAPEICHRRKRTSHKQAYMHL